MFKPLDDQIVGAKEILIDFDPLDKKIDNFVDKIEEMAQNGTSCQADIKVNPNNHLNGLKLERHMERLKKKLDVNEVVKGLCLFHSSAEQKLNELSEMCVGKN
ncbi:MAG TPA: hypothetical protein VIJ14_11125 [Rhabdochlamydiaceae bacterium]